LILNTRPQSLANSFALPAGYPTGLFQNLVGPEYGVRWIETFELSRNEASLNRELTGGNDLYPAREIHRDPDHYFGFPYAWQYNTMLIEPPVYLNAMLRDFYIAGGKLVVKEFRAREEIRRLPEPVIFNCTGLGAARCSVISNWNRCADNWKCFCRNRRLTTVISAAATCFRAAMELFWAAPGTTATGHLHQSRNRPRNS